MEWIFVIYNICWIYPLWLLRCHFTNKDDIFTLTKFFIPASIIVVISFLNYLGYLSSIYSVLSELCVAISAINLAISTAGNHPLPYKAPMLKGVMVESIWKLLID